ncbi:hypothetical protein GCM10022402_27800 [Salinactinospora qingdaonensis]|uniref:Uncharacterized protein n=1 Tax=Salinactinospora qingdaonensis TaxID=702744 RepID=A0ABP7FT90_9ACTN
MRSALVRYMPYRTAGRTAYEAANSTILGNIDRLFAVWDGHPADGKGGTGDTVETAHAKGVPVEIIWPEGARRE